MTSALFSPTVTQHETVARLSGLLRPLKPDVLIGIESRGFPVAASLAVPLETGFIMLRKKGKLPGKTVAHHYLEYGADTMEFRKVS